MRRIRALGLSLLALSVLPLASARAEDAAPGGAPPAPPAPPAAPAPAPAAADASDRFSLGFQAVPAAAISPDSRRKANLPDVGVIAFNIVAAGPADAAGMLNGDVILKVAGHDVPSTKDFDLHSPFAFQTFSDDFDRLAGPLSAGTKVEVVVKRGDETKTLSLTAAAERGYIGFTAMPVVALTKKQRERCKITVEKGVVAMRVTKGGPAADAGLRDGDVILKYAGQETPSAEGVDMKKPETLDAFAKAFSKLANATRPGKKAEIVVERDGKPVTLTATAIDFMTMQRISVSAAPQEGDEDGEDGEEGGEHEGREGPEHPEKPPQPPTPPSQPAPPAPQPK